MILIVEGAAVSVDGDSPVELGPGHHIGGFTVGQRLPQPHTVLATTHLVIDVYDPRDFASMIDRVPTVGKNLEDAITDHRVGQRAPSHEPPELGPIEEMIGTYRATWIRRAGHVG